MEKNKVPRVRGPILLGELDVLSNEGILSLDERNTILDLIQLGMTTNAAYLDLAAEKMKGKRETNEKLLERCLPAGGHKP